MKTHLKSTNQIFTIKSLWLCLALKYWIYIKQLYCFFKKVYYSLRKIWFICNASDIKLYDVTLHCQTKVDHPPSQVWALKKVIQEIVISIKALFTIVVLNAFRGLQGTLKKILYNNKQKKHTIIFSNRAKISFSEVIFDERSSNWYEVDDEAVDQSLAFGLGWDNGGRSFLLPGIRILANLSSWTNNENTLQNMKSTK